MKLLEQYPRPWRAVQDETVDPDRYGGGYEVYAANGAVVILGGTFSGDGDAEFNLNRLQVEELVAIVNGH